MHLVLIIILGIFGVVVGFLQYSFMMRMRTKCALWWLGVVILALAIVHLVVGINGQSNRVGITNTIMNKIASQTCGIAWDDNISNCSQCVVTNHSRTETCCDFLGEDLKDGLCFPNATDGTLTGLMRNRIDNLCFPVHIILIFIAIYCFYLVFAQWMYLLNQKEWMEKDEQEELMRRGNILTEEDLAKLGEKQAAPLGYLPTRAGMSLYVLGLPSF